MLVEQTAHDILQKLTTKVGSFRSCPTRDPHPLSPSPGWISIAMLVVASTHQPQIPPGSRGSRGGKPLGAQASSIQATYISRPHVSWPQQSEGSLIRGPLNGPRPPPKAGHVDGLFGGPEGAPGEPLGGPVWGPLGGPLGTSRGPVGLCDP